MAYIDQANRPSPTGVAAVVAVHAALGALLVTGLTVTGAIAPPTEILDAFDIKQKPPETPPPPPPEVDPVPVEPAVSTPVVPEPPIALLPRQRDFETTEIIRDRPIQPVIGNLDLPPPIPKPLPKPSVTPTIPAVDPVGARPRNDPGRWLSDRDYRTAWVRRELTGVAKFQLQIAANGSVSGCRITGSTGHGELDAATCKLVSDRAKFEPARDTTGAAVAGSYSGAVSWVLPR